jgi:hypothetical protein
MKTVFCRFRYDKIDEASRISISRTAEVHTIFIDFKNDGCAGTCSEQFLNVIHFFGEVDRI